MITTSTNSIDTYLSQLILSPEAIPVIGLPRSGKSTLVKNIITQCDLSRIARLYISNDEFDGYENELVDIVLKRFGFAPDDMRCLEILAEFSKTRIVVIDSLKNLIFEGTSLRRGGISNRVFDYLNQLHQIAEKHELTILYTINSGSNDVSFNEEIVSIMEGCSKSIITVADYQANLFLYGESGIRASHSDILKTINKFN